jgi:hypothetical protein
MDEKHIDERLLADIDEVLRERSKSESDMPWMSMKVENRLRARDQAKRWLKDSPGGLVPSWHGIWSGWSATIWLWRLLGAAFAGGAVGFGLGRVFLSGGETTSGFIGPVVLCGAFLGALISLWPDFREFRSM